MPQGPLDTAFGSDQKCLIYLMNEFNQCLQLVIMLQKKTNQKSSLTRSNNVKHITNTSGIQRGREAGSEDRLILVISALMNENLSRRGGKNRLSLGPYSPFSLINCSYRGPSNNVCISHLSPSPFPKLTLSVMVREICTSLRYTLFHCLYVFTWAAY